MPLAFVPTPNPFSSLRRWVLGALFCLLTAASAGANDDRVTNGLVAYYPLTEGTGEWTVDRSPTAEPIDLLVGGRLTWLADTTGENGIELDGGRIGHPHVDLTPSPPLALIAALKATGQSTFELWVTPSDLSTSGQPERMLSLGNRIMIGQQNDEIQVWLRHTGKDGNANPRLVTTNSPLSTSLTHIVHTFDGTTETLYVNGVANPTTVVSSGNFSNWGDNARLAFGQDTAVQPENIYTGFRWTGEMRLVAVYDRALSPGEVSTNFAAGADETLVWAGPDLATQGLPGQPSQSVTLLGEVPSVSASAEWSVVSAPPGGNAIFGDDTQPTTTADFDLDGTYVLRLTASEPGFTSTDEVRVDVNVLSTDIPVAANVVPADGAIGIPLDPRLEITCEADATAARYVIATDDTFASVVYDSGESEFYYCATKAFAGLSGNTTYAFSARVRDANGLWSDWSPATGFTTTDPSLLSTVSLQQGANGYTGAGDVDIRGYSEDPANPNVIWNQGAQDVLRTGRRVDSTIENYRSLLQFDVSGTGPPDGLVDAYLELTGWMHGAVTANDFVFQAPHVFYEVLVPWGEGTGITDPPQPGEASWRHSAEPTLWNVGGAGGVGTDRGATPLVRGAIRNELDHQTQWSSVEFVEMVRNWLETPGDNDGLLLQAEDEVQPRTMKLGAKESPLAYRPRLVLEFQEPADVVLTTPGIDFAAAGGSTAVGVEVRYADGTLVSSDVTTQITFAPSGNAAITGVNVGVGDGGYGVPGGAETVTVVGGLAEVQVADAVAEIFAITFTNDAGLTDPAPDAITVSGSPTQVVLTLPGSDFIAGASTSVGLEVRDAMGNLAVDDSTTQLTLSPSGGGTISAVDVGTGDGSYGVVSGAETITVAGGQAQVSVTDFIAETFSIGFTNGSGLTDPPADSITVSPAAGGQLTVTVPGSDFSAGASTNLTVSVRDPFGNPVTTDSTTQVTFTPSGSAAISAVPTGAGDGSYGTPGGAETVTVSGGFAAVTLVDAVAEVFTVSFANDGGLSNPAPDSIAVSPGAASQLVLTTPGADFAAGATTPLGVAVQDALGNLVSADSSTQVTFAPSGSASVAGVTAGMGDGSYGVAGGAEVVTVAGGVATIVLQDTVAETFSVSFANGSGLANPAPDSIDVSAAAPAAIVLTAAGADFVAGAGTALSIAVHDAFGNPVLSDGATQVTFTPTGSGRVTAVNAGIGDGGYDVPGGAETVTVAGGVASIAVNDDVAETFDIAFANGSALANPAPDQIVVTAGAPYQIGVATPGDDFIAGASTNLTVEVQDAFGNRIAGDSTTQVTFTPSGGAFVSAVVGGVGDGDYGVVGGAEIVTVSAGAATIALGDEVAETFTVAFANDAALVNAAPDAIDVSPAAAASLALAVAGVDFVAGTGTSLQLQILDAFGNVTTGDDTTQLTFTPSGSASIDGVTTGTGDGGYGAPGGAETVTVAGGVAAIALGDTVAETFGVTFANDAALPNPAPDSITVSPAAPSQVGVTIPGADFAAGASTSVGVAIQDAFGNPIFGDSTTQVTFTPSGSASISAVTTGTGDGGYGVPAGAETVTVAGGLASITVENTTAEIFTVSFANGAGLANAAPDSIAVSAAAAAQFVLAAAAPDFAAGEGSSLSVAVQDVYGNVVASDSTTQVAFSPSGNAAVTAVTTGAGDGSYGAIAFPEVVTVAAGVATVTVNDTVAETFSVALANDAGFANPPADSITVIAGAATDVTLSLPGADFDADGTTPLSVAIRDVYGNVVAQDDTTNVTFTPSGSANVSDVTVGTGDGAYGIAAGPETVTVAGGVATIVLADAVAEIFTVSFANDAALADPAPDSISVAPGAPVQLALTTAGVDFAAGAGTGLEVQVQDVSGNLVTADGATQVTFTPTGSAAITGVATGTGDGGYGVSAGAEIVTVSGGVAAITLGDTVAETFTVSFANDAALADPAPDAITVAAAAASEVFLATPGVDFTAGGSTVVGVVLRDAFGNPTTGDSSTQITFTPSGSAAIAGVPTGTGDGGYGVPGGAEIVTVASGQATVSVSDTTAETFSVSFANGAALTNPPPDSITVTASAPNQVGITLPGADFTAGGTTPLEVSVQDAFGNPIAADGTTQVTFAPTGNAAITTVVTGVGDGGYGVPAGAETVTVSGGVARVILADTTAETFVVTFSNGAGLADPGPDAITVSPGAASELVLSVPGGDFAAGGSTDLEVELRDAFGNVATDDSSTLVTFTPSGSAAISGVLTGTGDGAYGVPATAEVVTVSSGAAAVALENTVAEVFSVSFANSAALPGPGPDSIAVSAGAAAEVALTVPGEDFDAGAGSTSLSIAIRDAFGNVVTDDSSTQVTFTPSGSAFVSAVSGGSGDGSYGVPGASETVTVAGGAATIVLEDATPEVFTVSFANDSGLADPPPDAIRARGLVDVPALGWAARVALVSLLAGLGGAARRRCKSERIARERRG